MGDNGILLHFFIGLEGLEMRLNKIPMGECDCAAGGGGGGGGGLGS